MPEDEGRIVVPGFAILGLACLLIETLQSFREHSGQTTELIIKFLRRPRFGNAFEDERVARSFAHGVRDGILHEAETRKWVVHRDRPPGLVAPEGRGYALNRTQFCDALKKEFEDYTAEVSRPENAELRKRFAMKMDDIVNEC